ncbi:MAG: efflux RND transporter periplasmic adaptor subunit, partial [Desulfuromonadales bacterium]|nr:efflux RND transporter periplasmic adaptor subunit [Desulfuromonadales bacterium]
MSQSKRAIRMSALVGIISAIGLSLALTGCRSDTPVPGTDQATSTSVETAEQPVQQYTCGMHPMIITDEPGQCPICGMDLTPLKSTGGTASAKPAGERKIKYWAAPMDPTYIRDEPGKSPMGMDLVPVYEDEVSGGSVITIDPVVQQNMGVRMSPVVRKDLSRTVSTVGLVAYEEPEQFSINSKIDGWVERLYANETGQFVKKGSPLLEIYSPALVSAQEEFLLARNNKSSLAQSRFPSIAEGASRLLEASRRRLKLWDISDRQIARLEKTGEVAKNLTLYAPYDGIVTMKMVKEGQFIKSGMEMLILSDISKVWVYADIYEYELPWIKIGQKARITLPYVGSEPIESEVSYIYPFVEPKTRTVKARFDIDNPDFTLKPDMYVNVRLASQSVENALSVPVEAVLHSGEKQTVFVALGDGKFEPRRVKTGVQNDSGDIEIVQGLLEGEEVVTSAQFMLDSESKLREAIAKMLEPKTSPGSTVREQGGDE